MKVHSKLRTAISAVAGVAVVASAALIGAAPASAATNIEIGVNAVGTNAAAQYAIDNGIFAKNGLNAKLRVTPAVPLLVQALQAGQIQFMYIPLANALTARTNGGIDLKMVAPANGISKNDAKRMLTDRRFAQVTDPSSFCIRKNSGIKSGKDLSGKTIAIGSRGGLAELDFSEYIRKGGGDPKSVKWTVASMANGIDLVKRGVADAAYATTPFNTTCLEDGLDILTQADFVVNPAGGPTAGWITTSKYASANPAVVKAFQKSMYEANAAINNKANKAKFYQSASTLTKQPVEYFANQKTPYFYPTMTKADVVAWANALQRNGLVVKPVDVAGIIAPQYRP